jgi:hypothetical protein
MSNVMRILISLRTTSDTVNGKRRLLLLDQKFETTSVIYSTCDWS